MFAFSSVFQQYFFLSHFALGCTKTRWCWRVFSITFSPSLSLSTSSHSLSSLRQMERHAALTGGNTQFLSHRFTVRVLGQLEIVDARHDRRQILVGILIWIQRFAHDRQRRIQWFKAARWQTRRTRYELQQQPLFVTCVRAHDVEQIMNGLAVLRETVIGATAIEQHANVPALEIDGTAAAKDMLQFFRIENAQPCRWKDRIETWAN